MGFHKSKDRSAAASPHKHFPCLNGFRAIAVIAVIAFHIVSVFSLNASSMPAPFLRIASLGFLGVDIFFVLSGFLISGLLFNDIKLYGSIQPFRFYSRRAFKIIPHYLTVIICASLLAPIAGLGSFPYYFCFMQNYVQPIDSLGHLWSVAVEEHFYVFLPLLLIVLSRLNQKNAVKTQLIAFVFLIIVGNLVRSILWRNADPSEPNHPSFFQMTHLRFDALLFGCLLRLLYEQTWFPRVLTAFLFRNLLFLFSLFISLFFFFNPFASNTLRWWHYTLAYLASGGAILSALGGYGPLRMITEQPLLDYIGRSSYGIYLWHYIVLLPIVKIYDNAYRDPKLILLYVVLTLAIGILSTITIERYFLRLREKISP